ncbi:hypothetical protein ES703_77949 [subsurface metagenome]
MIEDAEAGFGTSVFRIVTGEVVVKVKKMLVTCATLLWAGLICTTIGCAEQERCRWIVHDMSRPRPPVVTPGEQPGQPPSNAIVLFDGKDLSQWVSPLLSCESKKGDGPAKWKVENGYMEVVKETGDIRTKQSFGDCHLHIEWATPAKVRGSGQDRGNSGVFLMSTYELQILDSYNNKTYADGQAAALYGRKPPSVNACRPPGQWQSFDIIFHRPIFKDGQVRRRATFTIFHNGVLVHDHYELTGGTWWRGPHAISEYEEHPDKLPLMLQDHGDPIRFRNIWLVELPEKPR